MRPKIFSSTPKIAKATRQAAATHVGPQASDEQLNATTRAMSEVLDGSQGKVLYRHGGRQGQKLSSHKASLWQRFKYEESSAQHTKSAVNQLKHLADQHVARSSRSDADAYKAAARELQTLVGALTNRLVPTDELRLAVRRLAELTRPAHD